MYRQTASMVECSKPLCIVITLVMTVIKDTNIKKVYKKTHKQGTNINKVYKKWHKFEYRSGTFADNFACGRRGPMALDRLSHRFPKSRSTKQPKRWRLTLSQTHVKELSVARSARSNGQCSEQRGWELRSA